MNNLLGPSESFGESRAAPAEVVRNPMNDLLGPSESFGESRTAAARASMSGGSEPRTPRPRSASHWGGSSSLTFLPVVCAGKLARLLDAGRGPLRLELAAQRRGLGL